MKTSKHYSPKISINLETIETLIKNCNQAINHSVQTEVFIKHNPHVHVNELRKTLATVVSELVNTKQWICFAGRVNEITEELDELNQEDKDRYEPDQEFSYLHDIIDEYVSETEKQFNYEPSDEELSDSYGFTAKERADQAWQQKMEAKS